MALPLDSILKQLADSGIISPGKLEEFVPPKANPTSVEGLVAELVKHSQLTPFQAAQVKAGKVRALILGSYTIVDRIGAGGMGQVFKAQHRRMKRVVAIKMLRAALTKDAAALARFEREVEAAAKLNHTNIVTAYDADQANGVHFLVMEYVEGKDLSALVKKDGPLPVGKAVNYILQAARGLEFAHGEGVVHRDIKPANLLLDKKGVVKILDMGLARIDAGSDAATQAELTGTGAVMGTVDYMAPEQALNTKHADQRADIYSLGITLYYLLAGKAAYGGESLMEKLMAHQTQPIPSLQEVQATVSKPLDAVYRKMVAKKKEDRYQSMGEVVEALEALGFGGSTTKGHSEVATAAQLSTEERKKLAASAKKKPLSTLTDTVASEKTKHLIIKVVGGAFGTIIAPILVFYLIRQLEKEDKPSAPPPAATAPAASESPVVMATNTTTQSPAQVIDEGLPKPLVAPFDAKQAKAGQAVWAKYLGTTVETTNSVGMRMTLIPPGEFLMGSTPEQVAWCRKSGEDDKMQPNDPYFVRITDETPQHKVTISQPFLMGSTEVTVAQFSKFVQASKYETEAEKYGFGNSGDKTIEKAAEVNKGINWKNPGYAITDDTAVTQITWNDACACCTWLSEQEQRRPWYRPDGKGGWLIAAHADGYRLPTEAEWEYACRAGTTTQYSFGDDKAQLDQYGWFNKNAGGKVQPVALKRPSPFGLFDIHGNVQEWCQNWYDGKWHDTTSPSDPTGPSSGSVRVIRGGGWRDSPSLCRSASRHFGGTPSSRNLNNGFRCVRVADAGDTQLGTNSKALPTALVTSEGGQPKQSWETPAFQKWIADTQELPAEQQIEAVSKKLMELNPGFDGTLAGSDGKPTPRVEGGIVTAVRFDINHVTDISPLRVWMQLKSVDCWSAVQRQSKLSDLSPLAGMPLNELKCTYSQLADLSALQGMPLTVLNFTGSAIADLSPLRGMALEIITLNGCAKVRDLAPLAGMPLASVSLNNTSVADLSPLETCSKLVSLHAYRSGVKSATVTALQESLPNCKIEWNDAAGVVAGQAAKPWDKPAFQRWVAETQKLPAEQQIEAVSKKLMELNPGFDGKVAGYLGNGQAKIADRVVTEIGLVADHITDISPIRALPELKYLSCDGKTAGKARFSDLSPLHGMKVTTLHFGYTPVSDLSPLEGMPLSYLACSNTTVSDLAPLKGMPLTVLWCNNTLVTDLAAIQGMQLTFLSCAQTRVSDLSPLRGMPLTRLDCDTTQVSDLSPLSGTKLTEIAFTPKQITQGLDAVRQMQSLKRIGTSGARNEQISAAEFWKRFDAGEFGKPAPLSKLAYLDPAFQEWVKATQALPAEQQIEAVSKKLMELNPGFDGNLSGFGSNGPPKVENGVVTHCGYNSDAVTDISPLRALVGLNSLWCVGRTVGKSKLSDLSPLRGMKLSKLNISTSDVADLSPLQGMPLERLECLYSPITDLSPLEGMRLTYLNCSATQVSDLTPLRGMPLMSLYCGNRNLFSLSPLKGMTFSYLNCSHSQVSDLSPLESCTNLTTLVTSSTAVTAAAMAALQKALPNCKIEWHGPAKTVAKRLAYLEPTFQKWVEETQRVPPQQQIEAVSKKLMELNPGFDGKLTGASRTGTPEIENGVVTGIGFVSDDVADISPARALSGLQVLEVSSSNWAKCKLSDISPLNGMPLTRLEVNGLQVTDLSPLQGMQLTHLSVNASYKVVDLSPLEGMPLNHLNCGATQVSDISVLRGMPLTFLNISFTKVSDLSPLEGCKSLKSLGIRNKHATSSGVAALQKALPNCKIEWDDPAKAVAAQPWETPAFQKWVADTQKLPAEQQLEAVSQKLVELNPGFDGTLLSHLESGKPQIEDGVVTALMVPTFNVVDISPLRALSGLRILRCSGGKLGKGKLSDLSPLEGLRLKGFNCFNTQVSDLSPLKGMPLSDLAFGETLVVDLSPLQGMPLTTLDCGRTPITDLSPLRGIQLTELKCALMRVSDLSPLKGMPLLRLFCEKTQVSDLSPLKGMPLTHLYCDHAQVSDLSPLNECLSLKLLQATATKVTPAQVAALQKALPNCKIEWDEPAKQPPVQRASRDSSVRRA